MEHYFVRYIVWAVALIILYLVEGIFGLTTRRNMQYEPRRIYPIAERIGLILRRRRALKKCKDFVSKTKNAIILRNSNVTVVYDLLKRSIVCFNAKHLTSVDYEDQIKLIYEGYHDNSFELFFDDLCMSFSEKTTYIGVARHMRERFERVISKDQEMQERKAVRTYPNKNIIEKSIDINSASEKELSKLPGINIAIAKKIKQRIAAKGYYEDVEQMCNEMKIKQHFRAKLKKLAFAIYIEKEEKATDNDERIVD